MNGDSWRDGKKKEVGWRSEEMEKVKFEQQKTVRTCGGSKNIVLGNTKNQTSGTKTETETEKVLQKPRHGGNKFQ